MTEHPHLRRRVKERISSVEVSEGGSIGGKWPNTGVKYGLGPLWKTGNSSKGTTTGGLGPLWETGDPSKRTTTGVGEGLRLRQDLRVFVESVWTKVLSTRGPQWTNDKQKEGDGEVPRRCIRYVVSNEKQRITDRVTDRVLSTSYLQTTYLLISDWSL